MWKEVIKVQNVDVTAEAPRSRREGARGTANIGVSQAMTAYTSCFSQLGTNTLVWTWKKLLQVLSAIMLGIINVTKKS